MGDVAGWRIAYLIVAGLGAAAAMAVGSTLPPRRLTSTVPVGDGTRTVVVGRATIVGALAAISQYGTVAFFPLFAVEVWDLGAGDAALLLALSRVLSVPVKTISGHLSDQLGPLRTVRILGSVLLVGGLAWVAAPNAIWGVGPAVVFAATVSGVFPIANLLALDEMGSSGARLGAFRSIQMGAGAIAAAGIGLGVAAVGLRLTLAVSVGAPLALLLVAADRSR